MRIKKLIKPMLWGVCTAGVLVLTLPYWVAPVMRPVAGHFGIVWETHIRQNYHELVLQQVGFVTDTVQFEGDQVHIRMPLSWLGGMLSRSRTPFVEVEGWQLGIATLRGEGHAASTVEPGRAWLERMDTLRNQLSRWLPVLSLKEGVIHADSRSETLQVERGVVELTRDDPYSLKLDITSGGQVFGYDIRMILHGTQADPILEFSATPPLGSDAVLLMLTTGQLPERELEFTGPQRTARLVLFLGQHLLYELTGDENVGDRLVIESGRNISQGGRETYVIRYDVNERLSLTGEYDEYDAINAGMKWRLYSR